MPDTFIGQEIDGFRILEELGRGGMGVVYKAEDVALARPVALKMIARELSRDESFVRRFRSEARALARINSPYITSIYALRRTDDGIFIVMEFIGGGTVGDKMERGPLKWHEIRAPFLEMISALEHAHGVGVIHRDIKPGNILLTEDGHVKVTDFGLAKLHTADQGMTVTQGIAGTLYYMSPEQVKGERNLDGRSDLYALGITIYEALSGRLPFERGGSEFSTMRKIVEDTYPPLGEFVPDLPVGLESAVMKALAKSPDDRYPNAAAMRAAFEAIGGSAAPVAHTSPPPRREMETVVAGEAYQSAAAPPPPVAVAKREAPKRGLMIGGGILAVLTLAALAYFFWPSGDTTPLSVTTDPAGATVTFNGRRLGVTPLTSVAVTGDGGNLRVEAAGYATVDTTLSFTEGEPMTLRLPLVEFETPVEGAQVALLNVTSNPSGAVVVVNGERVGETPYTHRDSTGRPLALRLERRGYQPYSRTGIVLNPASPTDVRAELERESVAGPTTPPATNPDTRPDPPPAQTGTLVLRAQGGGTVTVNGQTRTDSGTFTVPTGSQSVQCTHPDYGSTSGNVTIRPGETTNATCYFLGNVNVQAATDSGPTWGSVWVNGNYQGETGVINLPAGRHTVEVRREGYRTLTSERTVTIRAGLQQQSERLVFQLQKEG